jgi:glycosyltransferase involved in cell wall biosynthesis
MKKILFITTNHLGNKNYNDMMISVFNKLDIAYEIIVLERNEGIIKLPFCSIIECFYCSFLVYRKYLKLNKTFGLIFFHGSELIFFFSKIKSKKIMSLDAPKFSIKIPKSVLYKDRSIKTKFNFFIFKTLYKRSFSRVDVFLPLTNLCRQILYEKFSIPQFKIKIIPIYLDIKVWHPVKKEISGKCLLVGNNLERKGGYFIIEVFEKYLQKNSLTIITSDNIKKRSNIKVLIGLSRQDIIKEYQQADLFLFPTFFDQFGIVITEAMACGVPIIMRNIGGGVELVKDSQSGIVLPYKSSELDWAQCIQSLFIDRQKLNQFSKNARSFAEKNFSKDVNSNILRKVIKDLSVNK